MSFQYKITLFTPTYNRAYILDKLYRSVQRQTFRDFEWLIIDDGSSDNTEALVRGWMDDGNDFPIRYEKVPNGGKCRAINRGLDLAQGELFFIMDSDYEFMHIINVRPIHNLSTFMKVSAKEQIALGQAEIEVDPALVEYDPIEENDNDASLIIKIYYQDDEWLLPGDIEKEAIEVWLSENTQTFDIVKMPHHGRKEGNTKEFIENTDPSIAVITDSTEDEANKKVLKQLDKKNIPYYRSSVDGTITITGNGSGIYEVTKEE